MSGAPWSQKPDVRQQPTVPEDAGSPAFAIRGDLISPLRPRKSRLGTGFRSTGGGVTEPTADPAPDFRIAAKLRPDALLGAGRLRLLRFRFALGLRWLRALRLRRAAFTLHVDAAAEMRALCDRAPGRDDVAVHRAVVA